MAKRPKEDCSKRKSAAYRGVCKTKNLVRGHTKLKNPFKKKLPKNRA